MNAIDGGIWSHFISPFCTSAKSYGLTLPLVARMVGLGQLPRQARRKVSPLRRAQPAKSRLMLVVPRSSPSPLLIV